MTTVYILVVDDEKLFVEITSRRLRQSGYTVAGIFGGQEATFRIRNDA